MNYQKLYPYRDVFNHVSKIWVFTNILLVFIFGTIAFPAQATSLKNFSLLKELKLNKNENHLSLDNESFDLVPKISKLSSKNSEDKNELQPDLLKEVQATVKEVKEANNITKETIDGKTVYFYNLETTKPSNLASSANVSKASQVRWRLSTPRQARKVSEPFTGMGLLLAFAVLTTKYKLKQSRKF
jgi:hypothetical protein